jgi:UDP-N-acetylglucosamine acyltransferase
LSEALDRIQREIEPNLYIQHWVQFCKASRRGLIDLQGVSTRPEGLDPVAEYEELLEEEIN